MTEADACLEVDVCIVGGGPSGTSIASRLVALGHSTIVVDATDGSRPHPAATLPSEILPLFGHLGVREKVENAGFLRSDEIVVLWENPRPEIRRKGDSPGFQIDRQRFDSLLQEAARDAGAHFVQPAVAKAPVRLRDGTWSVPVDGSSSVREIRSKFFVDASGSRAIRFGRRTRKSAPTVALFSQWQVAEHYREGGCVEAKESEWIWCAPFRPRSVIAAVFLDPEQLRHDPDRNSRYHNALRESKVASRWTQGGRPGRISVCDASFWLAEPAAGDGYLRVGDSSLTFDPLSSQGILHGITSALRAAIVINTCLRRESNSAMALDFYIERQEQQSRNQLAIAAEQYQLMTSRYGTSFWERRAENAVPKLKNESPIIDFPDLEASVRLSSAASVRATPVITGDFVESESALYHERLASPVAFLSNVHLPTLLNDINESHSVREILKKWSRKHPNAICHDIVRWLWSNQVLVQSP